MTGHRFKGDKYGTRRGERYGPEHQHARAAAAARHRPTDPCTRCRQDLGPMSPNLHYDHNDAGTGYLGFAHARCNTRAAALKGNARQNRRRAGAEQWNSRKWT